MSRSHVIKWVCATVHRNFPGLFFPLCLAFNLFFALHSHPVACGLDWHLIFSRLSFDFGAKGVGEAEYIFKSFVARYVSTLMSNREIIRRCGFFHKWIKTLLETSILLKVILTIAHIFLFEQFVFTVCSALAHFKNFYHGWYEGKFLWHINHHNSARLFIRKSFFFTRY